MAITGSDLKFKQSFEVSDAATNGGRLGTLDVPSTYFPDVSGSERQTGLTRYRKFFLKNEQKLAGTGRKDLSLMVPKVFLRRPSPGGDSFMIKQGTQDSVQSDAAAYTNLAGVGYLNGNVALGATSIVVACEVGSGFRTSGLAYITDGIVGEFVTISDAVFTGNLCTLTVAPTQNAYTAFAGVATNADITSPNTIGKTAAGFTTNEFQDDYVVLTEGTGAGQIRKVTSNTFTTLTVDYAWSVVPDATTDFAILKSFVSMVEELPTVTCTATAPVYTPAATGTGTINPTFIFLFPEGAVKENWVLTFTSPTAYTIFATIRNVQVGTGITSGAGAKPANGTSFYFEIEGAAFGGAFEVNDTITFSTYPSAEPFWVIQTVAANTPAHASDRVELMVTGDSA